MDVYRQVSDAVYVAFWMAVVFVGFLAAIAGAELYDRRAFDDRWEWRHGSDGVGVYQGDVRIAFPSDVIRRDIVLTSGWHD